MSGLEHIFFIGAHISVEGGLHKAPERAASIGCSTLQIFTKSNRQWFAKPLSEDEVVAFKESIRKHNIRSVTVHASYLINLASPQIETRTRSINALIKELDRCNALGVDYLVLHPGSHVNQTIEKGLALIIEGINKVFEKNHGSTMLLLETMAGQGSSLGHTFEQIATLRQEIKEKKRVGICLDTCHTFAAGHEFSTKETYEEMWNEFDKIIGLKHLKVIHVNDSKKECGSGVDRHEDIGKGQIGLKGFEFLFNDPRFFDIPKILETPKEDLSDDKRNIEIIKKLLSSSTKKILHL